MAEPVKLYVYDLSQGMARTMSLQLTGKQIDGIWHTSVVVYGQEFYFGQGIMTSMPGTTMHGQPLEIIDIGETYLPLEVVVEYIDSLRSIYTAEKYHLLDFNCNTFSNDLCQFLCGQVIPAHITSLPSDFLNTTFGQSILPMIENIFGQSKLRSSLSTTATAQPPITDTAGASSLLQGISSAATSAAPVQADPVQIANSASVVDGFIQSYKAVIVFFTSATCPPCRMIKPDFEKLIRDKNDPQQQQKKIKILGVIMDLSMSIDGAKYGVRATPTFQLFLNGNKFSEFRGANYAELKSQVDMLLFEAYPPHPHRKILLRSIVDQPNVPILYTQPGKLDMIYGKLKEFIKQTDIHLDEDQQRILDQSKQLLEGKCKELDFNQWTSFVEHLLCNLALDKLFPLLDIYRSVLVNRAVSELYVKERKNKTLLTDMILLRIFELVSSTSSATTKEGTLSKATWLMILRVACNTFANPKLSTTHFTSKLPASHRNETTQMVVTSLLAEDAQVRQAAASLAYNCSTVIALERLKKEEGSFTGMAEQEDDEWEVELCSAIIDALMKESDEEIIHRLLAALGKFLFLAPQNDSSLCDLLSTLDIKRIIEEKKTSKLIVSSKVVALARDLCELLNQQSKN
ncbi:PPPDE putative peptidase domain-containing protein [Mycotypha africana]|uniref:PPPDE putative peptidase domain-containing protein n=1 Tax=Mycotypha africana TaxID=64632 RepID=UPI0023016E23|nr:PPPDE putative peptidase domain-containing protein [Mycotypha africana]KAI8987973.1 PPPDE putative peptidase domain-containing protein [Mycotypha africana]